MMELFRRYGGSYSDLPYKHYVNSIATIDNFRLHGGLSTEINRRRLCKGHAFSSGMSKLHEWMLYSFGAVEDGRAPIMRNLGFS